VDESPARPRRGRQAEAERNDRRVLEAAREVFAAHGPGASVADVAERAGVGIGSLYRRYGSKTDLLRRLCVLAMEQAIEAAEAALAAADPRDGLAGYVRACVGFRSGALASLAGAVETTPEMWEVSRRSRRLLDEVVARAARAGALRPDVTALDVSWLIELFSRQAAGPAGDDEQHVRQRLLAIALDGLLARDAPPLPAPAPSARAYEDRWRYRPDGRANVPGRP
jgi:AcrR family transcriptional regulator